MGPAGASDIAYLCVLGTLTFGGADVVCLVLGMENGNRYLNYPIFVSTKTYNMDIRICIRF